MWPLLLLVLIKENKKTVQIYLFEIYTKLNIFQKVKKLKLKISLTQERPKKYIPSNGQAVIKTAIENNVNEHYFDSLQKINLSPKYAENYTDY